MCNFSFFDTTDFSSIDQNILMTGQDRTKLTFKLDFPGNLWLAAFTILAMFGL